MDFQIDIVAVTLLVNGIVEGAKKLTGIEGKGALALALGAGFVFGGLSYGIAEGLISPDAIPYIKWVAYSVAVALASIGVYEFGKRGVGLYRAANQR